MTLVSDKNYTGKEEAAIDRSEELLANFLSCRKGVIVCELLIVYKGVCMLLGCQPDLFASI